MNIHKSRRFLLGILLCLLGIACSCPGSAIIFRATRTPTPSRLTLAQTRTTSAPPALPRLATSTTARGSGLPPTFSIPIKSPFVMDVVLAEGVKGDYLEPTNPTLIFQKNSSIYAVVQLQNAPINTQVTATWYVVDVGSAVRPNTRIDETVVSSSGTRNIAFSVKPTTTWLPGSYRVEISINGVLSNRVIYTVR